jgi:hypothetical protein
VPVERWGEAVGILAQANPARGQQVAQLLSNVQQIQQAQAVQCNSKPEERRRHVEAWSRQQDAEVEIAIGKLTPVQGQEFANDTFTFFESNGVSRGDLQRAIDRNPDLRAKSFQLVAWQGHQYRKMMSAPKAVATKDLPPVTRPGISSHRSGSDNSSRLDPSASLDGATSKACPGALQVRQ